MAELADAQDLKSCEVTLVPVSYTHLYFSPEAAFHGVERGLRYGPSEEILLTYLRGDGSQIYVGKRNH